MSSVYDDDGLDPWSSTPSPAPPPIPSFSSPAGFSSVIGKGLKCVLGMNVSLTALTGDASVPSIYQRAFAAVDPSNTGETSVNALSRVLGTSNLPASTIDKVYSQLHSV